MGEYRRIEKVLPQDAPFWLKRQFMVIRGTKTLENLVARQI
jgi:hypothetical protein